MTWHLKDHALEKTLNKYSSPHWTFIDALNDAIEDEFSASGEITNESCISVWFSRIGSDNKPWASKFCIFGDEIEEVNEYDPQQWNKYPAVTPPVGVWMQLENHHGAGFKARYTGNGEWRDFYGVSQIVFDGRFRPWEE